MVDSMYFFIDYSLLKAKVKMVCSSNAVGSSKIVLLFCLSKWVLLVTYFLCFNSVMYPIQNEDLWQIEYADIHKYMQICYKYI